MSTLRRFYRDTRALSPVVATILLVAIAVIASVLTYLWATGFIGAIQTRPSQATETVHIQAASIGVGLTPAFTIYVQDAGLQGVTYTTVFLLNTAGSVLGTQGAPTVAATSGTCAGVPLVCSAGSVAAVTGTIAGFTTIAGTQYILQVVTAKGTATEVTVTA